MSPLKLDEVVEACDWLERDYTAGGLLGEHRANEQVYQLNHVPKFGDDLSRGRTIVFPIPRMSEWVGNVVNQTITYPTTPFLTQLGSGLSPSEADRLEASISLILADANDGQILTDEAYRGFLRNTHVVYQVVPGAHGEQSPFKITLPQITSVFFERFKGGRPPMVARSYDMLIRDAETKYSGKRGEHDGASKKATYDPLSKRMKYTPLSGELEHGQTLGVSGHGKLGDLVHIRELYDDEFCYHVMYAKDDTHYKNGQEVLRQPTVTNGPPFFVVPSNPQGAGLWTEDWRAIGWPLYSRIVQLERMESEQQTRGEQAMEHFIARLPPDQMAAAQELRDAGYGITFHSGPNAIPIAADEIVQLKTMTNEGLEVRIVRHAEWMERWIASWLYPATEQTISQANVGTAQIGMQVVHQQESGLLSKHTRGMAGCAEMILHALSDKYASDREFYAKDEVAYGRLGAKKVQPGSSIKVEAATLKKVKVYGPDANVRVEVVTRSETESELEQREAGVWNNVQRGSQTFDEFIAVRNPDVAGQHEALAKDAVRKSLAMVYDQAIPILAAKRNLERWGVDVELLMQPAMMAQPGSVATGGATTMQQAAPAVNGADVSSAGGAMPAGAMR